jgi:hypothetical protein
VFHHFRQDIVALVNEAHLPAIYPEREYADDGGLMAYGANVPDNFRRAAAPTLGTGSSSLTWKTPREFTSMSSRPR